MANFSIIESCIYRPKYLIGSIISKHLTSFHHLFPTKKQLELEFINNKSLESLLIKVLYMC